MDYSVIRHVLSNNNFKEKKILVIGDLILDEFCECEINRISPEAPVPVANPKHSEFMPGGAGNVAMNIAALSASVTLIGRLGNDSAAKLFETNLSKNIILRSIKDYIPTTHKKRYVSSGTHLLRVDTEENIELSKEKTKELIELVDKLSSEHDCIVISDYMKGLISKDLVDSIKGLNKPVYVDSKPQHFDLFSKVKLIKPNRKEAAKYLDISEDKIDSNKVKELSEKLNCDILLTLGAEGMIFNSGSTLFKVDSFRKKIYDVSGAGDTALAAYVLSNLEFDEKTSAEFSSFVSGIAISKPNTSTVSLEEVEKEL